MSLMSHLHENLLKRGRLRYLLPDPDDLDDAEEREAAREEIAARTAHEESVRAEVKKAIARLDALNDRNHYGESLRRAFGGK